MFKASLLAHWIHESLFPPLLFKWRSWPTETRRRISSLEHPLRMLWRNLESNQNILATSAWVAMQSFESFVPMFVFCVCDGATQSHISAFLPYSFCFSVQQGWLCHLPNLAGRSIHKTMCCKGSSRAQIKIVEREWTANQFVGADWQNHRNS